MKAKKIIAVLLAALMLLSVGSVAAFAETRNRNGLLITDEQAALIAAFEDGQGPETNGYALDYKFFSPVKDGDTTKYPLVIWLHGMNEGNYNGEQIFENPIAYWASDDFQSRFQNAGGAFILAPRSVEEEGLYWEVSLIEPLRATIDSFIAAHKDNIDVTRIYIGGFSMGGKMTLKMAIAYPEMFAAAFPICPAWLPLPEDDVFENLADLPIWMTSSILDPGVNYYFIATPIWKNIKKNAANPENVRFSSVGLVYTTEGKRPPSDHFSWLAVTNDMFYTDNKEYRNTKTVDGNEQQVELTYPEGMISWLSGFTSDYDGTPIEGSGNFDTSYGNLNNTFSLDMLLKLYMKVVNFFKDLGNKIKNLFSR
ncbi:MAG: hypothetical protein IJ766_07770 [Clostridia bacterium]|nr:hypothetical protein [Clostridia bacterium]